jgi:hypothetical protein
MCRLKYLSHTSGVDWKLDKIDEEMDQCVYLFSLELIHIS